MYRIRNILRAGAEHLTDRQRSRLQLAFAAAERHVSVEVAWQCAQQLRSVYHQPAPADGRRIAEKILATFPSCPIPEIARLGRTLNQWKDAFLGYFTTNDANNGGTESITASSNSPDGSPKASATPTTTASECSSSAADSNYDPTLKSEEPVNTSQRQATSRRRLSQPSPEA